MGCPVCDLMDQQATSSSHRTRPPSRPPSVHSGRPSLTTLGPFGDRCSFIPSLLPCPPPSLCCPFRGALSLGFPSLLCPGHPAPLPSPARWMTPSLLGTWCRQVCLLLHPAAWQLGPGTDAEPAVMHLTLSAAQTRELLKGHTGQRFKNCFSFHCFLRDLHSASLRDTVRTLDDYALWVPNSFPFPPEFLPNW